jgi:nudix-type nucleoside diphosphatase (YffH/AdpP family)
MDRPFRIKHEGVISEGWGTLRSITYEAADKQGKLQEKKAELYDKGNAVSVLLYNQEKGTVILTRQFRLATVYKGNSTGMLVEAIAGMLDGLSPEDAARKEIEEETGYIIENVEPVMQLYMSPGVFTEILHFFIASYTPEDKRRPGGGLEEEGELIERLEIPFEEALEMINRGEIIDAKTVILLQHVRIWGIM